MAKHRTSARIALGIIAIAALFVGTDVGAAEKMSLPQSAVQTVDGAPLSLDQASTTGQQVLIYVLPGSTVSRRLLDAIRGWELPSPANVFIVVGGTRADAVAFAKVDEGLASVRWLVDPDGAARTDLQVTGVPTLFGIRNGVIEWRLAGVLNDPEALRSIVTQWTSPVGR